MDLTDGRRVRCHLDQVKEDTTTADVSDSTVVTGTTDDDFLIPMPHQSQTELTSSSNNDENESGNGPRHSQRTICPPARYLPDSD